MQTKALHPGRFFLDGFACWAVLGFLFFSFFVPLHFLPWTGWHSEMLVFVGVMLTCGLLLLKRVYQSGSGNVVHLPPITVLVASVPVLTLMQWLSGMLPYGGDALVVGFYAALGVCCLALGYAKPVGQVVDIPVASNRVTPSTGLACMFLMAGLGSTAIAWVQLLDVWDSADWIARGFTLRRPGANLGQPNHLALLLALSTVSILYLRFIFKSIGTVTWLGLIALLGSGLALTESRAGICAVLLGIGWFSFAKNEGEQPATNGWHLRRFGVAAAVIVVAFFFSVPKAYGVLIDDFTGSGRLVASQMRLTVWPQLIEAMLIKPWFGWGVLQVAPAHNAVADAYPVAQAFTYSHTVFLDLAIWFGMPIALFVVVYLAYWFWSRYAKARTNETIYAGTVLLVVAVGSIVEFSYSYAFFLAPALFCAGVLERSNVEKPCLSLGARLAFTFLMLSAGLMAWSTVEYLALEEDIRVARFQASRIGNTPQGYKAPTTLLLTQLSAVANNSRIKVTPDMPPEQLTALKNSALRYPWTATQSRYALALAMNGNLKEGQRQLHVMRAQHGNLIFLRVVNELNLQLLQKKSVHRFSLD